MNFFAEWIIYWLVKSFGAIVRILPVSAALAVGRGIGRLAYYGDFKHRSIAYANIKAAFAKTKSYPEIKSIAKQVFGNYGQNLVELLRLPLLNAANYERYVQIEGREHAEAALKGGKGLILLAMHFGSWELSSVACAMLSRQYKVIVKPQKRYSRLDQLLNDYRGCGGSVVIERGVGTRELIKSLKNNEIIGMVVDQGGRDGVLVPFFERQASMSSGAIRIGIKMGVPICFAVIVRTGKSEGPYHRLIIHEPMVLDQTDDGEADVVSNLRKVTANMEKYIQEYPAEYMWFYKIWKYAKESVTLILNDGRTGHLRQSQAVASTIEKALAERGVTSSAVVQDVVFRNRWFQRLMSLISLFANSYFFHGRAGMLRWFLRPESCQGLLSCKADFVISCGSSLAAVNFLLANDFLAKSIVIMRPGLLSYDRFDLVILPEHDKAPKETTSLVAVTKGAPNLISPEYLEEQARLLTRRYSHLKYSGKIKIGVLLGGDTKDYEFTESYARTVMNQIKEVANEFNAEVLMTTSRRTASGVENILAREFKKHPCCELLILANRHNVPEAVGGILGLANILVVSGDSISMVSEAASSGKETIVFPIQVRNPEGKRPHKHIAFLDRLQAQGYIVSADVKDIGRTIYDVAKKKISTKKLDDYEIILAAVKQVI
ncbi:MAG: ELM1/GtrOC1 family putative glycosyltransferase [Candidatus Omnitrophota bacterium]|nr:ELM1/GtrOC1 family putative glycosyltransferase [Candidatus Omnitrophota bacterium]MDZ4243257.1 ELM1/GtrOC1 family putative glycosyltransferase [Candidatus Omnitrophota bacterium]